MQNVIVTPHIATISDVRSERTLTLVAENLRSSVRGDALLSVVDLEQGY
jgi:phosphoglycerate dehydrogenase-like enzyme